MAVLGSVYVWLWHVLVQKEGVQMRQLAVGNLCCVLIP